MLVVQEHFRAGYFYVIQPIPAYPYHIKIGISQNVQRRLKDYKVLCPHARVLKTWHLFDVVEVEDDAINFLMCKDYHRIGGEVFFARDPQKLIDDLDGFFNSTRSEYHEWDRRGAVLTIEEAARYMGMTYAQALSLVHAGELPSLRQSSQDRHLLAMETVKLYVFAHPENDLNFSFRSQIAVKLKQPE